MVGQGLDAGRQHVRVHQRVRSLQGHGWHGSATPGRHTAEGASNYLGKVGQDERDILLVRLHVSARYQCDANHEASRGTHNHRSGHLLLKKGVEVEEHELVEPGDRSVTQIKSTFNPRGGKRSPLLF